MSNHSRKSCPEIAFGAGGQHLQSLFKSVGRSLNVRYVRMEVRIVRVPKQCDRVYRRQKLMQQFHTFWSSNTKKIAHTGEVAARSTETFDQAHLDRISADREDDRDRFCCCLCGKCRWEVECPNHRYITAHQFSRKRR